MFASKTCWFKSSHKELFFPPMLPPKKTSYTHQKLHSIIHYQQTRQTQEALWWNSMIGQTMRFFLMVKRNVKTFVTRFYVAVAKSTGLVVTSSNKKHSVDFKIAVGCGTSLHESSLIHVKGLKWVPGPIRGGYFIGKNNKMKKQTQLFKVYYPADCTAGTYNFFFNCEIIQH